MKKTYIFMLSALALLASCYDDRGGNDYDTELPDVEMIIPEDAYSAALGEQITITPEVNTTIDENDLEFKWEVLGTSLYNDQGRNYFTPLVNDDEQGKVLTYTCHLDSAIAALNNSYTCRLHARQKSTGRDFYSTNQFTITIAGLTGLLVLHGDDSKCDVGVLAAEEFMPASNSIPETASASSNLYSQNNDGATISGKGKSIVHAVVSYYSYYSGYADRFRIFVQTDKDAAWLNNTNLGYYGDWNSMFYLQGEKAVNDNDPQGLQLYGNYWVAFDGDDMFLCAPTQTYPFLFAEYTPDTECGDGNKLTFAPALLDVASSGVQAVGYATSINGDTSRKGFVGLNQVYAGNMTQYTQMIDTKSDDVKFNPADMKADLVKMAADSRAHVMAVLKGDATNATYAGKYFAVDIYPNASAAGESGNQDKPQYIYDLSSQTDISNALAFEFGSTKNMCYYATPNGVYQYGVDGETLYPAESLGMADGGTLTISGEVTMMKFLDSPNISAHNSEPILLVATYSGGSPALYALHMDETTGKVLTAIKYDSSNVSGWNFGKIYDVNIKAI